MRLVEIPDTYTLTKYVSLTLFTTLWSSLRPKLEGKCLHEHSGSEMFTCTVNIVTIQGSTIFDVLFTLYVIRSDQN